MSGDFIYWAAILAIPVVAGSVTVAVHLWLRRNWSLQEKAQRIHDDLAGDHEPTAPEPPKLPEPTYQDMVDAWNRNVGRWEEEIARARQTAQARMVEEYKSVKLTIHDYYATPDCHPITTISYLPEGDGELQYIEVDERTMPHDQAGYAFLTRPQREAHVARVAARKAVYTQEEEGQPAPITGLRPDVKADILAHQTHRATVRRAADVAFAEELENIKVGIERAAREVFLKRPERIAEIKQEAFARGVDDEVVEEEFVAMMVAEAVSIAKKAYNSPGSNEILDRLTPERLANSDLFKF